MKHPDVKFIDASEWVELSWYNSGGTRAKRILQDPDGNEWYFKCSEKKPAKDGKPEKYYKYEFWSEVIAYQLGKQLGLDILRYDVAIHNDTIGCISPLMINREEEQLIEVGRYMTSLNHDFLPEDQATRSEYTFQLLEETLDSFNLSEYWPFFFKTLLFDAIIGNVDRHQENWAFIGKSGVIAKGLEVLEKIGNSSLDEYRNQDFLTKKMVESIIDKKTGRAKQEVEFVKLAFSTIVRSVAPIYDSGSSLARELTEKRIHLLLNDKQALDKYIRKGEAEIHWKKKKISHFELLENVLKSAYEEEIEKSASFLENWDPAFIDELLYSIDKQLPENWSSYCIPDERKKLIVKLLTLRSEKIKALINERV